MSGEKLIINIRQLVSDFGSSLESRISEEKVRLRTMIRRKGHYSGTEINEQWWKRYTRDKMFARGAGEYWYDGDAFYFRRYLTKTPIVIHFKDIKEIKTGKWHAGQWAGGRHIIKLIWQQGTLTLSSGFIFSKNHIEVQTLHQELQNFVKAKRAFNKASQPT